MEGFVIDVDTSFLITCHNRECCFWKSGGKVTQKTRFPALLQQSLVNLKGVVDEFDDVGY